jgi:hypothetical protein
LQEKNSENITQIIQIYKNRSIQQKKGKRSYIIGAITLDVVSWSKRRDDNLNVFERLMTGISMVFLVLVLVVK